QAVRTVSRSRGIFAESRREQYGVHALCQVVLPGEVAGKHIVGTAGEHELYLVTRCKRCQVFEKKSVGLSRSWTLDIHDLDDFRGDPHQRPFPAGLQQYTITV